MLVTVCILACIRGVVGSLFVALSEAGGRLLVRRDVVGN